MKWVGYEWRKWRSIIITNRKEAYRKTITGTTSIKTGEFCYQTFRDSEISSMERCSELQE